MNRIYYAATINFVLVQPVTKCQALGAFSIFLFKNILWMVNIQLFLSKTNLSANHNVQIYLRLNFSYLSYLPTISNAKGALIAWFVCWKFNGYLDMLRFESKLQHTIDWKHAFEVMRKSGKTLSKIGRDFVQTHLCAGEFPAWLTQTYGLGRPL